MELMRIFIAKVNDENVGTVTYPLADFHHKTDNAGICKFRIVGPLNFKNSL